MNHHPLHERENCSPATPVTSQTDRESHFAAFPDKRVYRKGAKVAKERQG
jgi:hypothetical protein